jgi:hypothetical protein
LESLQFGGASRYVSLHPRPLERQSLMLLNNCGRKTFAAFREYVSEFMFWVSVDDNDPQAVAAYNQFIKNNTPNKSHDLSDDDLEFLFRHVTPVPESVEDQD